MSDRQRPSPLAAKVGAKAKRKLEARLNPKRSVWLGLGAMGIVGWSIVIPTLLGVALGVWLDTHHPGSRSWTLALMVVGLAVGCANAWRWVAREDADLGDRPPSDPEGGQDG